MICVVCHAETPDVHGAGRPRKYCSSACRQRAYRQRRERGCARRPARTGQGGGAGPVVALVVLPTAMASAVEQVGIEQVWDLGDFLMGLARVNSPSAQVSEPVVDRPPDAE